MRRVSLCAAGRVALLLVASMLAGCAATTAPPLILVPAPTQRSSTYYQHGQPIASAATESTAVLLSADDCTLFGTPYLRVWLLYFNWTDHPVLLDPIHTVTARASIPSGTSHFGQPELPYKLLAEAENAKSRAQILTVFGGALQSAGAAMGTHPTTIRTSEGVVGTINDQDEKVAARTGVVARQTERRLDYISSAYEMFEASFTAGALRKHTVFPQSGVNGYLYIPVTPYDVAADRFRGTSMGLKAGAVTRWPSASITYTVKFDLPGLTDSLTFTPSVGE